ncbi:MAG: Ig-like domain-containing protein, partial [Chlorobiaceae bacterium]
MKVNDIYLAFLSAFDSTDKDFGSFFSDFQSYSASLQSDIERSLTEIVNLTGSVLPTYENISAAQYYAEYGSHQVQLRINGSGINKLFGGDITTGIVSVSSITVDYPSEAVHLSVSGSGIFTNLDTGAISGSFNSFQFTTPWINVIASGSISVASSSVTSPLDVFGHLQNLSISYPKDSVLLSLVGEINYYQDALGKINYSGDVNEISLGNDKADLTIKGDLSCTFDEKNGLNLSGNNLTTGIISVSSIAVNYPSQSLHLAFSGLGSGLSANMDTGAISGTFHSFHFTTPWLDVIASGSISVAGSSVLSSVNVVGALDALSITYPDEKFLLSILGDINYTQDASGQFHYDGGATEIRISKDGADLAIKGDFSCAFDEQHGLGLSGSVHEIDVQLGDVLIECIGDIRFGAKGVESASIHDLSILVNGTHYDASTINLKDLLVDWVGNDMIYVDQNGDWCINDAKIPLFSETIDYLLEKINPTPPTVITFSPSDSASGVAVGSDIVLTFSEAIQAGTGAIEIHSGSVTGALVAHYDVSTSHNLTIVGNTLTINPTENLAKSTHYFVTFADGSVKDMAGNCFAGTTTYDFTTAAGNTGVSIDFNGTPVGMPSKYEGFVDFVLDPAKLTGPGYLASFFVVNSYGATENISLFDVNNDTLPDTLTDNWTDSSGIARTMSASITWYSADIFVVHVTAGATTSSYDHWGRIAYDAQSNAVGMYTLTINPVFTLTPDAVPADALIATFTIPEKPGTWSLLDSDLNGVVDRMTRVQTYIDVNNVSQTSTNEYSLTWSDSTHWTARLTTVDLGVGPIFDNQGRPTTIPFYTHTATGPDVLHELPLVWQSKGADNVVATASLTNALSVKLLDTNGDNLPDQAIFTSLSLANSVEGGPLYTTIVNFTDWSSLKSTNTHLSAELQTSTDPSLMFTGTIKGTSSNPTTLAMPSYFMGSSGNVTDTTPPTIATFSPADGTSSVAVNRDIVLTFSEAIQKGTGIIAIHSSSATGAILASYDVVTSPNLTIAGNTLTINPTADLAHGTHFFVTISDGSVKDLAGNAYAGLSTYDFTTNSNGGMITTDFGGDDFGFSVAKLSDGKILVVGMSNGDFALASYNTDGSLDTTFSGDGKVTTDFLGNGFGFNIKVQDNGKLLVAGDNNDSLLLARYNRDGSLDTSFGTGGGVVLSSGGAGSVVEQSDGKILVAGATFISNSDFILARVNPDGGVDTSFGIGGKVTTDFGHDDQGASVAVQSDGRIVVTGMTWFGNNNCDFALACYTINGSLDANFGTGGKVTTDFGGTDESYRMTLQTDGKIIMAGGCNGDFAIARYNSDGNLDATFGGDGKVTTDFGGNDLGMGVTVQSDGKILVAGYAYAQEYEIMHRQSDGTFLVDNCNSDFAIARYNADGTLDGTFGVNGKVITDIGGTDFATDVTLQSDGKIVVSGYSNGDFALARYNTDGSLDTSFSGVSDTIAPTVITFSPSDAATGVAVGSNIVLTFSEAIQKGSGAIEIRSGTSDGALIAHYELATSPNLTIAGNTLTINPTADLASGTHYFVTFGNGNFTDFSGNPSTGTNTYDFTTDALPLHHNLTGSATFWKTGAPITGVTSSLTTALAVTGAQQPVEFRNIQLSADGTRTIEL